MKRWARYATVTLVCVLGSLVFVVIGGAAQNTATAKAADAKTELADGTYDIAYHVLQADSDSVSIANDYFQKPAALIVYNGVQYIELTVLQSEWVKSLQAASGSSFTDVDVIAVDEENNTRTVLFKVDGTVAEPMLMKMHIHIASLVPTYDHHYTVRFAFAAESIELTGDVPSYMMNADSKRHTIFAYSVLACIAVFLFFIIYKYVKERNK